MNKWVSNGGIQIIQAIKTWLIYGILALFEFKYPNFFFRIVAIVLYGINIVFWLSAWAWSASIAALWLGRPGLLRRERC